MRGTRSQPRPGLDRRAVVAGAGALGVAAVLTAAGSRAAAVESHGRSAFRKLSLSGCCGQLGDELR
jgi:threonine dehydrogenase-like Zn-dependent dehydrogenase